MNSTKANQSAPAFEKAQITIQAPVETVWQIISDFENWPQWNESVTKMSLSGPMEVGTSFVWVAGGLKIVSRIEHLDPPNIIVWSGKTIGINAIHRWVFEAGKEGTEAYTEESFEGFIVRLFSGRMRKMLASSLNQGLNALKVEAESRSL